MLWKELEQNLDSITAPNIMRRILENYFRFFGNVDVNKIIEEFPKAERAACNSLLSWVNDGSHHINDDLYVDSNQEINKNYFDIFKRIFENSNHESHFHMMTGNGYYQPEEKNKENESNDFHRAIKQAAATSN